MINNFISKFMSQSVFRYNIDSYKIESYGAAYMSGFLYYDFILTSVTTNKSTSIRLKESVKI